MLGVVETSRLVLGGDAQEASELESAEQNRREDADPEHLDDHACNLRAQETTI